MFRVSLFFVHLVWSDAESVPGAVAGRPARHYRLQTRNGGRSSVLQPISSASAAAQSSSSPQLQPFMKTDDDLPQRWWRRRAHHGEDRHWWNAWVRWGNLTGPTPMSRLCQWWSTPDWQSLSTPWCSREGRKSAVACCPATSEYRRPKQRVFHHRMR